MCTLSKHCNYGALTEEMIRDRIVVGLRDSNLSLKLQLDEKLDLQKAITQVREAETIKQQQLTLRGAQKETTVISTRGPPSPTRKSRDPNIDGHQNNQSTRQYVVNVASHHPTIVNTAQPKTLLAGNVARKRGHYKLMCRPV